MNGRPREVPRQRRVLVLAALAGLASAGAVVLYACPPGPGSFYPPCLFRAATGLHCPGCGSARCCHALLHGRLAQALAYNVALVVSLPFVVVGLLAEAWRYAKGLPPAAPRLPAWVVWAIAAAISLFWVLRNVPAEPFVWLAPHEITP